MAVDKLVDSTQLNADLTSVANAIRAKTGGSSQLAFPTDFVSEIESITGGMTITETQDVGGGTVISISGDATTVEPITITENGTVAAPSGKAYNPVTVNVPSGGGEISIDDLATNTLPAGTISVNSTRINAYAFVNKPITKIIAPNATRMGEYALMNTRIQNVIPDDFPILEGSLRGFSDMPELLSIKLTSAVSLGDGSGSLKNCKKLVSAEFPNAQAIATGTAAMQGCTILELMDLGNASRIGTSCFNQCPALRTIILRSSSVCALHNWNQAVMAGIYSNPTASTVYVPADLIEQYKVATNWSTAFNAGVSFVAIEGSAYE